MNNLPQKVEVHSTALALYSEEKISHVPKHLLPYIEAKKSPVLSSISKNKARNFIMDILLTLYAANGQKINEEKESDLELVNYMRDALYQDIVKKKPNATVEEIKEALNCGVRGEYEEKTGKLFGGITVVNCNRWIECYFGSSQRAAAFQALALPPKNEEPATPEELARIKSIQDAGFKMLKDNQQTRVANEEAVKKLKQEERNKKVVIRGTPVVLQNQINREQKWMVQFDKLFLKNGKEIPGGPRVIVRYGQILSMEQYLRYKLLQVGMIRDYLSLRNK